MISECPECKFFDIGVEDGQYPYCQLFDKEISREKFRKNNFNIIKDCHAQKELNATYERVYDV